MIDWFELGKTLYSVFILHSGVFQSVIGPWFFLSLRRFSTLKIQCSLSLSLTLHFDLFSIFDIIDYLGILVEWKKYSDLSVMIHWMSLIILLFTLFNDIMESIVMSWGDYYSFDLFLKSVEAFACVLHW